MYIARSNCCGQVGRCYSVRELQTCETISSGLPVGDGVVATSSTNRRVRNVMAEFALSLEASEA